MPGGAELDAPTSAGEVNQRCGVREPVRHLPDDALRVVGDEERAAGAPGRVVGHGAVGEADHALEPAGRAGPASGSTRSRSRAGPACRRGSGWRPARRGPRRAPARAPTTSAAACRRRSTRRPSRAPCCRSRRSCRRRPGRWCARGRTPGSPAPAPARTPGCPTGAGPRPDAGGPARERRARRRAGAPGAASQQVTDLDRGTLAGADGAVHVAGPVRRGLGAGPVHRPNGAGSPSRTAPSCRAHSWRPARRVVQLLLGPVVLDVARSGAAPASPNIAAKPSSTACRRFARDIGAVGAPGGPADEGQQHARACPPSGELSKTARAARSR